MHEGQAVLWACRQLGGASSSVEEPVLTTVAVRLHALC